MNISHDPPLFGRGQTIPAIQDGGRAQGVELAYQSRDLLPIVPMYGLHTVRHELEIGTKRMATLLQKMMRLPKHVAYRSNEKAVFQ